MRVFCLDRCLPSLLSSSLSFPITRLEKNIINNTRTGNTNNLKCTKHTKTCFQEVTIIETVSFNIQFDSRKTDLTRANIINNIVLLSVAVGFIFYAIFSTNRNMNRANLSEGDIRHITCAWFLANDGRVRVLQTTTSKRTVFQALGLVVKISSRTFPKNKALGPLLLFEIIANPSDEQAANWKRSVIWLNPSKLAQNKMQSIFWSVDEELTQPDTIISKSICILLTKAIVQSLFTAQFTYSSARPCVHRSSQSFLEGNQRGNA